MDNDKMLAGVQQAWRCRHLLAIALVTPVATVAIKTA